MPGYCVQGTVGHKILSGQRKLEMEGRQVVSLSSSMGLEVAGPPDADVCTLVLQLEVKMQVEYMSFSAHADAKGIMQLVGQAEPERVLLVHGEAKKMEFLRQKIEQEFRRWPRVLPRVTSRAHPWGWCRQVGQLGLRLFLHHPCPRGQLLHASQRRDGDATHEPQHPCGHLPGAAEARAGTGYEGQVGHQARWLVSGGLVLTATFSPQGCSLRPRSPGYCTAP